LIHRRLSLATTSFITVSFYCEIIDCNRYDGRALPPVRVIIISTDHTLMALLLYMFTFRHYRPLLIGLPPITTATSTMVSFIWNYLILIKILLME